MLKIYVDNEADLWNMKHLKKCCSKKNWDASTRNDYILAIFYLERRK